METEAIAAAGSAAANLDFSLAALFLRATFVVQIVMVVLLLASFWSWAIIIDKLIAFRRQRRDAGMFEDAFWSGQPLDQLFERLGGAPRSALERIFLAGMSEWRKSFTSGGGVAPGAQQRIDRALSVAIAREEESTAARLGFLATVGSISPFVGLFGTVWGIKTAFEEIAIQQNTNLATVAPGIAEALVATALGLLAAIPAVIFYNKLSGDAERLSGSMENFADEFGVILSRQIDRKPD
ncbi:protein TolQ [Pikeienuella piscinae]|uniref:Tol-Pal system protein TolQ n=1 Tax=Pikeienuella piscinae TaxID=2748098 RepID=A0A7L5BYI8_9RHOB|nr:protein TolQ [Pikeienuella piscinae]QIE55306.1 protein TolQ [Pikeienuella piscinae]